MKKLLTIGFCFFLGQFIHAQVNGEIVYNETITLAIAGMDEQMASMLPSSQSLKKELSFKNGKTLYQNMKGEELEDVEMESEDGSFKIKMISDDTEDILYKDIAAKKSVHQKGLMGKSFVVSDELVKHKWKITNEKIKYLDYECQKAVIEEEGNFVVAWFTSEIPAQIGPAMYHGLPGAILMISVNEGKREFKALEITLDEMEDLKIPSKGKKVSEEEYQKIQAEKLKEMQEMHGSKTIQIGNK